VWSNDLRALEFDGSNTYGEEDAIEPLVLVIGRLVDGADGPQGCRDVEGLDLSLPFTPFAPAAARIVVKDCPGITVADNRVRNTLGPPGASADGDGVGGGAGSITGIAIEGCGQAVVRDNVVELLRAGDGAPGDAGGPGGAGGGVVGMELTHSPGASLRGNRVRQLFSGASGAPGVGAPDGVAPTVGPVVGVRLGGSPGVQIQRLDIGRLLGASDATGLALQGSTLVAEHLLVHHVQGMRLGEGVTLDGESDAQVSLMTMASVSSPPGRGAAVGAAPGGAFEVTRSIIFDSPRVVADLGATGALEDVLLSEPAPGHAAAQNVATVGVVTEPSPEFVDERGGDYRLEVGSPGVDAGPADPAVCGDEPEGAACILDWGRYGNTDQATASD